MDLSRRTALRAGGGLLAGGVLAGCVERRVTRRETNVTSSTTWALSPATGHELDADAFASYVDDMATEYGDSGVYGLEDAPEGTFQTAYAQRLPVVRESSGQPGGAEPTLSPDEVDRGDGFPVVDAAVAKYGLEDGGSRYWLWAAVDVRNETFAGDAPATVLSAGLSVRNGTVDRTAAVARDDGAATVRFPTDPVGRFPLNETTDTVGTGDSTGEGGYYVVEWTGSVGGVQSVIGACDVTHDGDYDLGWTIGAGYRRVQRV